MRSRKILRKFICAMLTLNLFSSLAMGGEVEKKDAVKPKNIHYIMALGYYVREQEDKDWHINISGKISSLCGIYVIVYDDGGKVVYHGSVPCGEYSDKKPFSIKIPKDGVAGDYKIKIIGAQDDFLGINLPVSDLKEVYYITGTTIGHGKGRYVLFQTPPEQKEVILHAYKGHLKVKDNTGKVVGDSRKDSKYGGDKYGTKYRYSNYFTLKTSPGVTYRIEPEAFYFGCKEGLYVMFKPDSWFFPDKKLDNIKWWRLEYK